MRWTGQAPASAPHCSSPEAVRKVQPQPSGRLILFDGECNFCHAGVRWILRLDTKRRFRFASLQSPLARRLLGASGSDHASLVLWEQGSALRRSDAVLGIAAQLRQPLPQARHFRHVPRWLRDAVYDFVARWRFHIFGRRPHCEISAPAYRDRFVTSWEEPVA